MSKITGVEYRIPEKKRQYIEQKEEIKDVETKEINEDAEQIEPVKDSSNTVANKVQVKKIVPKKITVPSQSANVENDVMNNTATGAPKKPYKIKKIK